MAKARRKNARKAKKEQDQTVYRKVNGKYVAVGANVDISYMPLGFWLVTIRPGTRSSTRLLNPKIAELAAAAQIMREAMIKALVKASEPGLERSLRNPTAPIDEKLWRKAFDTAAEILNADTSRIGFVSQSMAGVVDEGIEALLNSMKVP